MDKMKLWKTSASTTAGPGRVATAALAGFALLVLSGPLHAQSGQGIGLEVTVGYQALTGDDFDGLDDAAAFETVGSYAWTDGWERGIGAGIASHGVEDAGDVSVDRTDVFGEGRYRFNVPAGPRPHLHPFLSGRLGYTSLSTDVDDDSRGGLLVGGGAGLEYWLSDEVGLVGATNLDYLSYGEVDDVEGTDASGLGLRVRGGLKVRFQ
jgi:hypothetical protein